MVHSYKWILAKCFKTSTKRLCFLKSILYKYLCTVVYKEDLVSSFYSVVMYKFMQFIVYGVVVWKLLIFLDSVANYSPSHGHLSIGPGWLVRYSSKSYRVFLLNHERQLLFKKKRMNAFDLIFLKFSLAPFD